MAAAVLAFAFLPVAYSRVAVTDVGALIGVALALMWSVRAAERAAGATTSSPAPRRAWRSRSSTPPGLVLLPLGDRRRWRGCAPTARGRWPGWRRRRWRPPSCSRCSTRTCSARPGDFWHDLRDQADVAANEPSRASSRAASPTTSTASPGASAGPGSRRRWRARCSSCGATWCAGSCWWRMPLALFVYLALQSRYFGRWLLPAYPALAMLAAWRWSRARRAACAAGAAARGGRAGRPRASCWPSRCAADVRTGAGARPPGHARAGARLPRPTTTRPSCGCRSSRPCRAATTAPTRRARSRPGSARCPRRAGLDRAAAGPTSGAGGRACARQLQARPVRSPRRRRARLGLPRWCWARA